MTRCYALGGHCEQKRYPHPNRGRRGLVRFGLAFGNAHQLSLLTDLTVAKL
jgi:hypothetical protein